jgi:hypothetical protein
VKCWAWWTEFGYAPTFPANKLAAIARIEKLFMITTFLSYQVVGILRDGVQDKYRNPKDMTVGRLWGNLGGRDGTKLQQLQSAAYSTHENHARS